MIERFVAGIIGAPFGVKGFVKVKSLSGEVEHLLRLKSVTVRTDGKEQQLNIEEADPLSGGRGGEPFLAIRFTGYSSPEVAKALSGAELLVDRENAAPLRPGEFYVEDLKGITVVASGEGEPILGQLTNIIEGGGGDLAEIRLQNGETRFVPFRKEFFPRIDLEKRQILLDNVWILA